MLVCQLGRHKYGGQYASKYTAKKASPTFLSENAPWNIEASSGSGLITSVKNGSFPQESQHLFVEADWFGMRTSFRARLFRSDQRHFCERSVFQAWNCQVIVFAAGFLARHSQSMLMSNKHWSRLHTGPECILATVPDSLSYSLNFRRRLFFTALWLKVNQTPFIYNVCPFRLLGIV